MFCVTCLMVILLNTLEVVNSQTSQQTNRMNRLRQDECSYEEIINRKRFAVKVKLSLSCAIVIIDQYDQR